MPRKVFGPQSRFRIGAALVQPDRLIVTSEGQDHALEPRVMEVLVVLAEHGGEVISAEQLLIEVWRGTFYGDNPVHKAINALRRVFGDDLKSPRYIETIRKRGYRLIAKVAYPDDYRRVAMQSPTWSDVSPFVGLNAFDSEHASVFFGRSRTTAELLSAMRRQIDHQRRFVLIVGASGCGKTSLLQAGAIPLLQQDGGFDGLRALSVANCDLAGVGVENAVRQLAAALAVWTLGERPVFAPQSSDDLAASLARQPESIATAIDEAFRRHPSRERSEHPYAHLLLVIDHAETLVSGQGTDSTQVNAFSRLLEQLCETPRVLVVMVVRGDFYLKLVESVPGIAERKTGDGHLDVLTPRPGEIAQIIRIPAAQAGLTFEEDPQTSAHLDDVLRDAAAEHPDALPLLQHTLQALYERRSEHGELGFDAYRDIGGLEGALAHRAEEVFASLPESAQRSLDNLLAQMIVMQPENESVSARRIAWSSLDDDARTLAETFVRARLFVAELGDGAPGLRVAHEALLRQWPRARDWAQDNRRILQARVRLQRAAARWVEEGRKDDHLLNPGRPLGEALEVHRLFFQEMSPEELLIVSSSQSAQRRMRSIKTAAMVILILLTATSFAMSTIAISSKKQAEDRRQEAQRLADFMLNDLAEKIDAQGDLNLLDSIGSEALAYLRHREIEDLNAQELENLSKAFSRIGQISMKKANNENAISAFNESFEAAKIGVEKNPESEKNLNQLGQAAYWVGYFHRENDDYEKAFEFWSKYDNISEKLLSRNPRNNTWVIEKSYSTNSLGTIEFDRGNFEQAKMQFELSKKLKEKILASSDATDVVRKDLVDTLTWIASCDESLGNLRLASEENSKQISDIRALVKSNPGAHSWNRMLANALARSAWLKATLNDQSSARHEISEAKSILFMLTKKEPENMSWLRDYAYVLMRTSDIDRMDGDIESSTENLSSAESIMIKLTNNSSQSVDEWKRLLASIELRQAFLTNDLNKGISIASRSIAVFKRNHDKKPNHYLTTISYAESVIARTLLLRKKNQRIDHDVALAANLLRSVPRTPRTTYSHAAISALANNRNERNSAILLLGKIGYACPNLPEIQFAIFGDGNGHCRFAKKVPPKNVFDTAGRPNTDRDRRSFP